MADFSLPIQRRREPMLPLRLPRPDPQRSAAGIMGQLPQLPPQMRGTDTYQAGVDQSREGVAARAATGMAEQLQGLTAEQQVSLAQHKAYREGLKAAQVQVDTRNNDLRLAQNLLIATDPNVDKSVRKFMLAGLSQASGVDPKGEYSQNLQKMVLGLKPDALEALRSSFGDDITNSPPGAIQQQLNGLFSGSVPIENVFAQVKASQEKKAAAAAALTSPGLPLTSGAPASGAAPIPEGAVAEGAAELAGGATSTPAAAPPSAQQRQAVIAAAGLTETAPAAQPTAAPATATPPPEVAPPEQVEPPSPIPPTSAGEAATEPTPTPPVATPPPVEPAAAAAGEAAGAGAVASPTTPTPQETPSAAQPPPEPTSRMEVPDSLRKAAEETGDKLLLDAIAKIDARNSVLDSDAAHRRTFSATGPANYTRPKIDLSLPAGPEKKPGSGVTARIGTGGRTAEDGIPLGAAAATDTSSTSAKAQEALQNAADNSVVLSPEQQTVLRGAANYGAAVEAAAEGDPKVPKGTVQEIITTKSPGEIHQEAMVQNNELARKNPAPKQPNVEALKPEERPLPDREISSAARELGVFKPGERYNMRDTQEYLPFLPDPLDKDANKVLSEQIRKKNQIAGEVQGSSTDISKILLDPAGAAATGGVKISVPWGGGDYVITPGTVSKFLEGLKSATGVSDENAATINNAVKKVIGDWKNANAANLSSDQIAVASARLEAALNRYAFAQAAAFNPRGTISNADVAAAAKNVGSLDMTSPQIHALLRDNSEAALRDARREVSTLTGRNLGHDWERALSEEERKNILAHHAATVGEGKSPYNLNDIKDIAAVQRDVEAKRQGLPERENKYLATSGGTRPEDYDKATSQKVTLERETKEQTFEHNKQKMDLENKRWEMDQEKWDYKKEQDRKQEARQAMLDARHAQEKMAAAFQHIGAMIAGSVKGAAVGGSGISAGPEDSSAFRLTPSAQRQAPRIGGVTPPTRYGGPIKRMQQ